MKRFSESRPRDEEQPVESNEGDTKSSEVTPNSDMQPEDAGTADSGNGAKDNPVQSAMKQTSKTDAERDGGDKTSR
jgi:hypothetical protein